MIRIQITTKSCDLHLDLDSNRLCCAVHLENRVTWHDGLSRVVLVPLPHEPRPHAHYLKLGRVIFPLRPNADFAAWSFFEYGDLEFFWLFLLCELRWLRETGIPISITGSVHMNVHMVCGRVHMHVQMAGHELL